nr:MAG TPA: hypothetical protein [Caudoviricetes sp.]
MISQFRPPQNKKGGGQKPPQNGRDDLNKHPQTPYIISI